MNLRTDTRKFWCAAYFYRRAPDRDTSMAVKVLEHVATTTTGAVRDRAETMLREIYGTDDTEPPRAS